jgi:hypothetical protein
MNTFSIDLCGYLALSINLYSMTLKGEERLRFFSAIANAIYVLYGILLGAIPLILGCSLAVILHVYRLKKLKNNKTLRNERI